MLASSCEISKIRDGDLIFFMRYSALNGNEFENAVCSVGHTPNVFHVGMFCANRQSIVHTVPADGVICEPIDDTVRRIDADHVDVFTVRNVSDTIAENASEWAMSRVGCKYNDIFSPDSLNSDGQEAYYCCELMIKAYGKCGIKDLCPEHQLNFADSKGVILPFWIEYYKVRNSLIPQGQKGSHPSKLITSKHLTRRFSKTFQRTMMKRFVVPQLLDQTLHFINGSRIAAAQTARTFDVIQPRSGSFVFYSLFF
ncbi:unnamed protein product [Anisakis simplex]|uniref:LRAT domain-containing protein n=1 Tax=Anisakis simplex TaxID=6269 RepID=A0A0M3KGX4_ANISI|nr:unnamed protein product [Anisakis simplex]